jgi:GTPase
LLVYHVYKLDKRRKELIDREIESYNNVINAHSCHLSLTDDELFILKKRCLQLKKLTSKSDDALISEEESSLDYEEILLESKKLEIEPGISFKMIAYSAFTITGHGTVVSGVIAYGSVRVNDKVKIFKHSDDTEREVTVSGIDVAGKLLDCATTDDGDVGLLLRSVKYGEIERGDIFMK